MTLDAGLSVTRQLSPGEQVSSVDAAAGTGQEEQVQPCLSDTAKRRTKWIWLNGTIQKGIAGISEELF